MVKEFHRQKFLRHINGAERDKSIQETRAKSMHNCEMRNLSVSAINTALWNRYLIWNFSCHNIAILVQKFRESPERHIWTQAYVGLTKLYTKN